MFLDRDGTLVREVDFLTSPSQLELLPGAGEAVADLNRAGLLVVLVTNQSGIARGLLTEPVLALIHDELARLLAEFGAHLDLVRYCPHHPDVGAAPYRRACECRKPAPGMLLDAARELELDLARSWAVGDSARDVESAVRAGARGILVATGKGPEQRAALEASGVPFFALPHLPDAARHVLADLAVQGK